MSTPKTETQSWSESDDRRLGVVISGNRIALAYGLTMNEAEARARGALDGSKSTIAPARRPAARVVQCLSYFGFVETQRLGTRPYILKRAGDTSELVLGVEDDDFIGAAMLAEIARAAGITRDDLDRVFAAMDKGERTQAPATVGAQIMAARGPGSKEMTRVPNGLTRVPKPTAR